MGFKVLIFKDIEFVSNIMGLKGDSNEHCLVGGLCNKLPSCDPTRCCPIGFCSLCGTQVWQMALILCVKENKLSITWNNGFLLKMQWPCPFERFGIYFPIVLRCFRESLSIDSVVDSSVQGVNWIFMWRKVTDTDEHMQLHIHINEVYLISNHLEMFDPQWYDKKILQTK